MSTPCDTSMDLSRASSFPPSFIFGVATSSVQIEGATSKGGRGKGIWDTFCNTPGKVFDGSTPDVTCDHFHKFKDDILDMKKLGVDAYRFSISWPRLFPESSDKVNEEGVAFYNDLIDCVIEAGLIPFVTLYHWDLPQFLQDDPLVKGWTTKHIVKHFLILAETCFKCFGDRVKHWITLNEIHMISVATYEFGFMAPGKSSDPGANAYTTAHHQLLSHATAVKIYRKNYQKKKQQGVIGLSADIACYEPMPAKQEDIDAAMRCDEFNMGWILDPVHFGDYPQIMKDLVGDLLPRFSEEESQDLKDSVDFIGFNYYFSFWVTNAKPNKVFPVHMKFPDDFNFFLKESKAEIHWKDADGNFLGEVTSSPEIGLYRNCPWGLKKILASLKSRYGDTPIYIVENGTDDPGTTMMPDGPLNDEKRVKFIQDHLSVLSESIRVDKVNVKGYFHWTFMDNWEWTSGFASRFGLHYIDFSDPLLKRVPKASAKWFTLFLKN